MGTITEAVIAFGSALAGAGAGAYLANRLERKSRQAETEKANIAATNRALLMLWQHWFALADYRDSYGSHWKSGDRNAWYTASLPYPRDVDRIAVDIASLDFLLETDDAEVVARITQEEEAFRSTKALIERRSEYFFDRVFPRLDAAGIPYGGSVPADATMKHVLGFQLVDELQKMYPEMIARSNQSIEGLGKLIADLRGIVSRRYPQYALLLSDYDLTYRK